jgi:hypothetical protein
MQKDRALKRWTVALVAGALASLTFAPTAQARPDDEYLLQRSLHDVVCPLERIGDQFVRCDNLTGNGVPAPWYVPQAQ